MNGRDDEIVMDAYVGLCTIVMVENTTQHNYTIYMISSL